MFVFVIAGERVPVNYAGTYWYIIHHWSVPKRLLIWGNSYDLVSDTERNSAMHHVYSLNYAGPVIQNAVSSLTLQ